jgi:phosphatidylglycerophosphatase C
MRDTIAVFDFDGTLTRNDTLLMFLLFQFGIRACLKAFWTNRETIKKYILREVSNHEAKQDIFSYFFKGMRINNFEAECQRFALYKIPNKIKKRALEKVMWHLQNDHTVVILSASVRNWIEPWAKTYGIKKVIATEIEIKNQKLTGRFLGKNCYGPEKFNRFLSQFPERSTYQLYAYGDSKGDRYILNFADFPYYRCF